MEAHWQFFLDNESTIRRYAKRIAYGKQDVIDELCSEAALRIGRIVETYDSSYGVTLKQYAMRSVYLYMWKHYKSLCKNVCVEFQEQDVPQFVDHDAREWVNTILSKLDDYDANLLTCYYIYGFTHKEIADKLGVSKGTARNHCITALERAKELSASCRS